MRKNFYIREAEKISFKRAGNYLFDNRTMFTFIVEYEGRYYDFSTGEEYELVEYDSMYGCQVIMNDILENTFYVRNVKPYKYANDESFNQALEVIKYNEHLDELKKQKKLVVFPQKKIN